jgi:OOP family OmpA-OmpF porin
MKKLHTSIVAGFLGIFAQAGIAQEAGFFVEGALGRTKADLGNTSGWTINNKDTTFGANVGYMFNDYIGVEGGYRDLGDVSGSATGTFSGSLYGKPLVGTGTLTLNADGKGWTLGPRLNLPVNKDFSLNARLGWFMWEANSKATVNAAFTWGGTAYLANAQATNNQTGTDTYYGLGASYNINKQLAAGINYNQYKLDSVKVDTWDLSLKYRF